MTDRPAPRLSEAWRRASWEPRLRQSERGRILLQVAKALEAEVASGAVEGMAFDLFLASIPLLALCGWALARVGSDNPDLVRDLTRMLSLAPGEVRLLVDDHAQRFSDGAAPLVLAGALWMASSALHTPMRVLEKVLAAPPRPWWQRRLIAITCVGAVLVAVVLSAALTLTLMGGPGVLLQALRQPHVEFAGQHYTGLVVGVVAVTSLLAGFFRIAVRLPPPRRVWPGSVICMVLISLASVLFAIYVNDLSSLAVYYGSLTAVAVFLLWLWLCSAGLLLGALVNAYLEARMRHRLGPVR
jgi:membrane protein